MLACWVATYTLLPAILVVFEKLRPFGGTGGKWLGQLRLHGIRYDGPFSALVRRAPRTIVTAGVALSLAGLVLVVPYIKKDPMEYDMRRLQNDLGQSAEMHRLSRLASSVLGANLEGAMVVALDRVDQVEPFVRKLEVRRARAEPDAKPFEAVHSILDFVPPEQEAKVPLLLALRERLARAHERGGVSEADWNELAPNLPPEDLRPFGIDELPDDLALPFSEKSGVRGRLVLIEPTAGKSDADLRYLLRWADSFRETRLPSGEIVRGSGRAVIFADMLQSVVRDIPRCIGLSMGMTVLAVLLTFRRGSSAVAVLAALAVGVGWVALGMALLHVRIHFLNFIALPVTFGIGVDYAVNFAQRYETEGRRNILQVLRNTGGAVILCSLTTTLGYLALLRSINQAIRGLGMLAVMGEVACLLAAVLVLPAALVWLERARLERKSVAQVTMSTPGGPQLGAH
jgi:hypothetical protein